MKLRPSLRFEATQDPGCYRIDGELTFSTATLALDMAIPLLQRPCLCLDLSGVIRADSAGLALLVEWQRMAAGTGCRLSYREMPQPLLALIRVGGIEGMLPMDHEPCPQAIGVRNCFGMT